jgi:hypothetical protein
MQVINRTRRQMLVEKGTVAARPWARLRGLIGRAGLNKGEGLLLDGTIGIHTIGMRFAIDVLFLDKDGRVLYLIQALKPFRCSPIVKRSAMVLELPAGILRATKTQIGDGLEISLTEPGKVETTRPPIVEGAK